MSAMPQERVDRIAAFGMTHRRAPSGTSTAALTLQAAPVFMPDPCAYMNWLDINTMASAEISNRLLWPLGTSSECLYVALW